tara:strand:+ start:287 stop:481 length:195 start_codon:yes stop_codon:yes gene_type:complete
MSSIKEMTDEELEEMIECFEEEIDNHETEIMIHQDELNKTKRKLKEYELEKQRRESNGCSGTNS